MTPRTLQRPASPCPDTLFAPVRRATWLAALCVGLSSTASAQDTPAGGSDLRLNGFGTLGVVDVLPHDGWGFRREIDQTEHHDEHLRADVAVQEAHRPDDEAADSMALDGVVEGVLYDITERKQVETDVRRRADHDALTGALNRNGIDEAIDRHLAHGDATDALTLLYLDLDGFKQINDRHGHHHGDEVLQQAVQRIQVELRRNTDLVGRIGGDEFVVALAHSGPTDVAASQIAANIVARLCEPFALGGAPSRRSASASAWPATRATAATGAS
jgi:GGDEF domain-containing protein